MSAKVTDGGAGQLQLLNDISESILAGNSLEEILTILSSRLPRFVPCDRIEISLADARSVAKGEPADGRSAADFPLQVQGHPIGRFQLFSRREAAFGPEHRRFLEGIVGHVAIAVERTRLLEDLRGKSEYLENILHNSADGIIVEDRQGIIRTWNEGARRIYGYSAGEVVGRPFETLVPPELQREHELDRIRERVFCDGFIKNYETTRVTRDGRRVIVNVTSTALHDRVGRTIGRSAIHRDVTNLRKLQEEVARTASLAAVGELAATVAHEIKNPLAGISGAIQVLEDAIPASDPRRPVVGEILGQIERLDNTVRDLLTFAQPADPVRQGIVIGDTLARAWGIVAPTASKIRFSVEGMPEGSVTADPQLLHQVWLNLFQNSIEAMPQGGDLRVTVGSGDPVAIEVSDTGVGIDASHLAKLFRPFFTTKTRGTGLGLAITRKLVEAHDGTIRIDSSPGRGTRVTLEIPR